MLDYRKKDHYENQRTIAFEPKSGELERIHRTRKASDSTRTLLVPEKFQDKWHGSVDCARRRRAQGEAKCGRFSYTFLLPPLPRCRLFGEPELTGPR